MMINPIVGGCIIVGWIIVMLLVLRAEMAIKKLNRVNRSNQDADILRRHNLDMQRERIEVLENELQILKDETHGPPW